MHLRQLKVREAKFLSLGLLKAANVSHLVFQAFHSMLLVLSVVQQLCCLGNQKLHLCLSVVRGDLKPRPRTRCKYSASTFVWTLSSMEKAHIEVARLICDLL